MATPLPTDSEIYDVAVVGAGPAGAACAGFCAMSGLRTLLLERSSFPREKVCGDCLNPLAWPVLERLGVRQRVLELAHARLERVEFKGCTGATLAVRLPVAEGGEIAVKRSVLDQLLLARAGELGSEILTETAVTGLQRAGEVWEIRTAAGTVRSRYLVGADGRNSSVARLLQLMPSTRKDRVGLQTHLPLPVGLDHAVRMQFVPHGYSGIADVGAGVANLCLVALPKDIEALQAWASAEYALPSEHSWRSITPLSRAPITPVHPGMLLVGDAARVVEPFTGEGISYALNSGELAARAIANGDLHTYQRAHADLYRGRLWINQVAKLACLHPHWATRLIAVARICPPLLTLLTRKVINPRQLVPTYT